MRITTKKKVILLLAAGLGLGFARAPKQYFKVLKETHREFQKLKRAELIRLVKEFYRERLVKFQENDDGTINIVLTENGRKKALVYNLDNLRIETPKKWDKKWRLVIFDIPERKKAARTAIRAKLKELGFYQLQKSVFIFPHPCEDEINFIVEVFEIRQYVRLVTALNITNESELKLRFELI